jgi:uncharacterized protein
VDRTILWRRIDQPGHEAARLLAMPDGWHLAGTAVFAHEGQPCHLAYDVRTDREWRTTGATVSGWVGSDAVDARVVADGRGTWTLNRAPCPRVEGCIDVDLNFSPSTNLLPIRRLALAEGEHAAVRAAWLRFPSFALEPLEQTYRRTGAGEYRYESAGGSFRRDLRVDAEGFVTEYPGIWIEEDA